MFDGINKFIENPIISILEREYELVFFLSSDYKVRMYNTVSKMINNIIYIVNTDAAIFSRLKRS